MSVRGSILSTSCRAISGAMYDGVPSGERMSRRLGAFGDEAGFPVKTEADHAVLADLRRVVETGEAPERKAAALALAASPEPEAKDMLATMGEPASAIANGRLSWDSLAQELQQAN